MTEATPPADAATPRPAEFRSLEALGPVRGAYNHLADAGDVVFTAAIGPFDPATGSTPEGATAQAEAVIDNLETALASVHLGLADVVKVTIIVEDFAANFAAVEAVYARRFAAPYPVRTVFGAQLPGPLVAMDVTALRRS